MHICSKNNICQKQQGYHMHENIVAANAGTRLVQDHTSQNYSPGEGEELIEPHPLAKEQLAIDGCSRGRVFFRDTAPREAMHAPSRTGSIRWTQRVFEKVYTKLGAKSRKGI